MSRKLLACGHPVACDGMAGDSGDQPGCGWCGDIADMKMLVDHLSRTYVHFTNGRVSKPNTRPEVVFSIADEIEAERIDEAVDDVL